MPDRLRPVRERLADQVTPILLTYNESPNLARTLEALQWARRVVVLDSGSQDNTEAIARRFPNTAWFTRPFDSHGAQWQHGISETGIGTPYLLALDADMRPTESLLDEISTHFLPGGYAAGTIAFEYWMLGRPLAGSLYPAQLRLMRTDLARSWQEGHTHVFGADGPHYRLRSHLIHDDRKPLEGWLRSQWQYAVLESRRIGHGPVAQLKDQLRVWGVMPLVAGSLAYLKAGGPFYGAPARAYAYERMLFETLLARTLLEGRQTVSPDA